MTCEKCGWMFKYYGNLTSHRTLCGGHSSKYHCDIYQKEYSNKKSLKLHRKKNHQDDVC